MRRIATRATLALAVLAALWGAGWAWLAQRAAATVDAEIAALATGGVLLSHGERETGGFPFAIVHRYGAVRLEAASGLWTLALAGVETVAPILSPGVMRAHLGPAGTMARIGTLTLHDGGAVAAEFALGAAGLTITMPLDAARPRAEVAGEALSLVAIGGEALVEGVLDLTAPRLSLERQILPGLAETGHGVALDAAALALAVAPRGSGLLHRTEITTGALRLEGTLAGLRGPDVASALAAPGRLSVAVEAADADILHLDYAVPATGPIALESLPVAGALRLKGPLAPALGIADGRLTLEASGKGLTAEIVKPAFAGRFAMDGAEARFMMPLRTQPLPEPFALALRLSGAAPDAETWAALDPRGRLVQAPLALTVDIGGEARLLDPAARLAAGRPLRVERIAVRALALDGFGARAAVTGELFPVPGQPEPDGRLSARVQGWTALLRALETVGLLDPVQSMLVMDVAEHLRDPADIDSLRAEVELAAGTLVVNGQRYR